MARRNPNDRIGVNDRGVIKGESVGEAIITVTATDGSGIFATCKVIVNPILATSIEIVPSTVEAEENTEVQLSVVVTPDNATIKEVAWTSSDTSVATVDETGLVSILKEGLAVITATTIDGSNLNATCVVTATSGISEMANTDFDINVEGVNIVVCDAKNGSQVFVYSKTGN